jgi:hypothetical protein
MISNDVTASSVVIPTPRANHQHMQRVTVADVFSTTMARTRINQSIE